MLGDLGTVEVLCAVAIFIWIWYCFSGSEDYWKERGVPGLKPSTLLGTLKGIMSAQHSVGEVVKKICDQFPNEPLIGWHMPGKPLLLVRDLELIKDVLIKDFSSFSERDVPVHETVEPLSAGLFSLETKRWRALRPKLSPAFTTGKMKHMFGLILECAEHFDKYLSVIVEKGEPIDCMEVSAKYTTDVIGSCAFGLQLNSLTDENSEFRQMGKKSFDHSGLKVRTLVLLRTLAPRLYDLLGIPVIPSDVSEFFTSSILQTIDYRRKNNVRRGDLVDTLIELQDTQHTDDFELTDSLLAAQAYVFFLAGFETSSTTISHALLELAQRQDIQERLRQEIIQSLKENDGRISYESVQAIKYLDMVFQETLRLRPPVVIHFRKAVKDYTFRGTNVTIPKGQVIWIPVEQIQQNPEYFPNPLVFDPERFTDEMCKARNPITYTPFGDGPRNCIGKRFAVYQTKLGLIKILAKYKVELSEKVRLPYKPNPKSFMLQPEGGVHLKFSKINPSQ